MTVRRVLAAPYTRIGGRMIAPPPLIARVQTDGSYGRLGARISAIVNPADDLHTWRYLEIISACNATETEWASVEMGLRHALENNQTAIGLENDNLGVIYGLTFPLNPLRHRYAIHWRKNILTLANETDWVGVRWIPRELNKADEILR